jgi:hypothetical protein
MKTIITLTLLLCFVSCAESETNEEKEKKLKIEAEMKVATEKLNNKSDSINEQKKLLEKASEDEKEATKNAIEKIDREIEEIENK